MPKPEPNAEGEIVHQKELVLPSPRDTPATATGEVSANLEPGLMAPEGRGGLESVLNEARRSEAELRRVIDTIPTLAWCNLANGCNEFVNKRWYEYTGLSPEQTHGWRWKPAIHPEDLPGLMQIWETVPELDKPVEREARLRRSDGVFRWFLFRCQARRDSTGAVARWYGTASDVEDQKQTDTLRGAEMRALDMITDGASLTDILNHVCTSIDLHIAPSITTILLMDPDGKRLWPSAGSGVPHDWARAITPLSVAPDTGLCGTAAFLKTRVIVPDVAAEPVWREDLRAVALKNGIRAGWSQPILTKDSQVLGTFAIYSSEPHVPTDTELALIGGAGHIALIAIERQGSQEALRIALDETRKSEEELRRITDVIPQTIVVLNPDGRADYANRVALEYTGLSLDEVRADDFRARVFHPDDIRRLREERQKALSGDVPFECEQRVLRKDGTYRWFLIRYNPLLDESGKVIRWYAAGTDIEDRKQVEEQLRREQEELRAKHALLELAQRAAHAMAFDWYIQKDLNTWSSGQEALYGLSPGTFDGKYESWKKLIHPDDWPLIVKAVKHSHETGNISAEFRVVWPDGSVHWLVARGQMFMDAEGRPYRMVGFTADISQRKVAEEALRRSEGYLTEAQGLTHTGSYGWSVKTGQTVYWSEETYRLYDFDPDDGLPSFEEFRERIHPEDRAKADDVMEKTIREKVPHEILFRAVLPDGSLKYIHSVGRPVLDQSGEVIEITGTNMDVTEQHNARAALERAFEEIKTLKDRLQGENIALREDIASSSMFEEIVGSSPALNKVLAQVEKVASTDSTVLLLGETGTGKELIARAIHNRSKRANRAFVTVNCAAIPPSLVASELFGYEKGAFTGATQRRVGRFESADGGTIFLDEIGELPPETQVALLRVLQERQLERLGGHQPISVDVRILAATNRDLAAAVQQGAFRQDLFYRLNVFPIQLPALRDRTGDIPVLVGYLVERYAQKASKKIRNISKKTLDLFQAYSWPGNIRELQNVVERAVILCEGETFSVDASWLAAVPAGSVSKTAPLVSDLARREKTMIEDALRESQGRISGPTGAAAKLGLPRQTLESKIKRLGIKRHRLKIS
jgi:PAS domain S-box-containing protein